MKFPFVRRKTMDLVVEQAVAYVRDQWAEDAVLLEKQLDAVALIKKENDELKVHIGSLTAASVVAEAIRELANAHSSGHEVLAAVVKNLVQAMGVQAAAQDKAANIQREWLEISKGNR